MMRVKTLLAVGMAVTAISLGAALAAQAHGPGANTANQTYGWHHGWHMGPMMGPGMGQGQMGPGMGQGMMGPGMRQDRMGSGMMGPGMRQDQMGRGMMQPLREDLTAKDVKHMMEHRLAWSGNPNVKVGKVEEQDDDTIIAEIVTQEGSLVERMKVDRHTGMMQPMR